MGAGLGLYALHADGREIPVEISLSPVTLDGDLAAIGAIRDVSVRKALEDERERLLAQAQEAVRLRDEFLSAISHDLGNPIAAIRMQSRLLRQELAATGSADTVRGQDLAEVRDATVQAGALEPPIDLAGGLEQIEATARRAWNLVEELLDLARLQVGRSLDLNWRPMDLVAAVRDAIAEQQAATDTHQIRLQLETARLPGEWDPARVERVITNLLSNAVKYSPNGGELVVRLYEEARTDVPGRWAVLEVRDSGIGIPASDLPHISERFRRASNVVGRFPGTGIGLAGAREIAEHHGGTLTIASREGAGTTVTVRLPLEEPLA